jgi:hypothetical protein
VTWEVTDEESLEDKARLAAMEKRVEPLVNRLSLQAQNWVTYFMQAIWPVE